MKKILVTSALPYANGSIHIGHLVEYVQTDIFVRFLRLTGREVIYICADDAHGAPIEINAAKQGLTPEQLIRKYHEEHQEDFRAFHISFDEFYTTHSPENKRYADLFFAKLKEQGLIYTKEVEGLFDEEAGRFLPDRYVKGECPKCRAKDQYGDVCEQCGATYSPKELTNPYSVISGNKPVRKRSVHYFFKLSAFSGRLQAWLTETPTLQQEVTHYVLRWIEQGLEDWDISRDGPYFGFPIPGETNKFYYVWLDAPIGYISAAQHYCDKHGKNIDDYWKDGEVIHFIGKDIIYFHFLFWPAMLMAAGFALPSAIVVHGFLTVNREKMSKSRGTFMTARSFLEQFHPETLRFYYAANLSSRMEDINLDFHDLQERINNELLANLANFVYRVLSFANANLESKLGEEIDHDFLREAACGRVDQHYSSYNFREAVKEILRISALGNKYFQDHEPWRLIKTKKKEAQKVITTCANLVKNLAIIIKPILPEYAAAVEQQLNLENLSWKDLPTELKGHALGKAEIIIRKIEQEGKVQEEKEQADPFAQLNIKVAKVLSVQAHPRADKLYIMQVDLGTERRQIVSGLREHYTEKELQGRLICILTNLEKAKFRGEGSDGMLLAAEKGGKVVLLEPKGKPGEQVFVEGIVPLAKRITINAFAKTEMVVKKSRVCYQDKALRTQEGEVTVGIEDGAKVS
ncbi:MAG TPA: methionine--tRNA ligase [Candidatus Nanoarchaeia archaeon]|nr:methionine--tRNA ligase [Candidatus Nanoarchaeia archaeon]